MTLVSEVCQILIAQLVKRVNGLEKYKKWAKLDPCFSFNKPTNKKIYIFWDGHDLNFAPNYFGGVMSGVG